MMKTIKMAMIRKNVKKAVTTITAKKTQRIRKTIVIRTMPVRKRMTMKDGRKGRKEAKTISRGRL